LAAALAACRGALIGVGALSGLLNVLMLSGSFFMLLVYDRVLPSQSVPTLVSLMVLIAVIYLFQGTLDLIRVRILVRIGAAVDVALSGRIYDAIARLSLLARPAGDGLQPLRDLDQVRAFMGGMGPTAFFDLPWMVIYLAVCFAFHWLIGLAALAGAAVLIALTFATERLTEAPVRAAGAHGAQRNVLAETARRNAEVMQALGMRRRVETTWRGANDAFLIAQQRASDVGGGLGVATRAFRMMLQSFVLAVGAWLVIEQKATAGVIIAASILTARALAPVELAIGSWKGFVGARQGWRRLEALLAALPRQAPRTALPAPRERLAVEALSVAPPGAAKLIVADISFSLSAGDALGVIGPSAAGKSTLARALVGVWRPARGAVRLDGAPLDQWDAEALGAHLGYLPQDAELMAGTVAQNVARFDPAADAAQVVDAARAAGVHELILRLAGGYDAPVGEGGTELSAGQRQRIALARALYGDPFLVVLDEPNANLDAEGEGALTEAIAGLRRRGAICVVIAHRPSALAAVNLVAFIEGGRLQAFGPRDEVLAKVTRAPSPLVGEGVGGADG
jgi:ATP-binding cassette subfamily C protein